MWVKPGEAVAVEPRSRSARLVPPSGCPNANQVKGTSVNYQIPGKLLRPTLALASDSLARKSRFRQPQSCGPPRTRRRGTHSGRASFRFHPGKGAMKEIYYVKSIDNSRLVPVLDPRAPRQYLAILFLATVAFGAMMLSAWQRFDSVEDGYRLEAFQREKQQILEANRKLRLEEASLGDPVRIDTIARNELGMTPLSPPQIVAGEPPRRPRMLPYWLMPAALPRPLPVPDQERCSGGALKSVTRDEVGGRPYALPLVTHRCFL